MIVLVVMDGLRPDFVSPELTPYLYGLKERGVAFLDHHSVFPTHTRVNVASIFTGRYPSGHGLLLNKMYLRLKDETYLRFTTGDRDTLLQVDSVVDGGLVQAPSLGEVLHTRGLTLVVVSVGSSGSAHLHHHRAETAGGVVVHPDFAVPAELAEEVAERWGPWPPVAVPNTARVKRAVDVLTDLVIPRYEPEVAALWMSDPDLSQHRAGLASPQARRALRGADAQLGRLLSRLEELDIADATDIIVASDHGHSTVARTVDLPALLVEAGLKRAPDSEDDVVVVGNGSVCALYLPGAEADDVARVARFLQGQPFCGPLFTKGGPETAPGTLPLSLVFGHHWRAPDLLMSFAWDAEANRHGVRGRVLSFDGVPEGMGEHGSLSPYEVQSTLIAAGPHFKEGALSLLPSSNADLFPTVLTLLGLGLPGPVDGRVLAEALRDGPDQEEAFGTRHLHTAQARLEDAEYRQELQVTSVAGALYVDKGRAFRVPP